MSYLNVMDFGAKGDGKTDDTKALLAAIEGAKKIRGYSLLSCRTLFYSSYKSTKPYHANGTFGMGIRK